MKVAGKISGKRVIVTLGVTGILGGVLGFGVGTLNERFSGRAVSSVDEGDQEVIVEDVGSSADDLKSVNRINIACQNNTETIGVNINNLALESSRGTIGILQHSEPKTTFSVTETQRGPLTTLRRLAVYKQIGVADGEGRSIDVQVARPLTPTTSVIEMRIEDPTGKNQGLLFVLKVQAPLGDLYSYMGSSATPVASKSVKAYLEAKTGVLRADGSTSGTNVGVQNLSCEISQVTHNSN